MIVVREEVASTNSDPLVLAADAPHGLTVAARSQTAGRGQRGNVWESAPGMNLSFSTVIRPQHIEASRQFVLSMAVALAVARVVRDELPDCLSDRVRVKWPNDIYVGDRKIAGILIENTLTGRRINKLVAGVGLNVNQQEFVSDAPNPVSLCMLSGREHELDGLLRRVSDAIVAACEQADAGGDEAAGTLLQRYCSELWRNDGELHRWAEMPSRRVVDAAIEEVGIDGTLSLRHADGSVRGYAFKEIAALI